METNRLIGNINFCPSLTKEEQDIILASRERQIKSITSKEIASKVTEVITNALIVLNGFKIDLKERALMELQIVKDLQESFKFFTLKEFEKAVYYGSRGYYKNKPDDIIFLSVSNIHQWVNAYRENTKSKIMKKQIDFDAKNEIIDIEKKKKEAEIITKNYLIEEFNKFLEGKPIYDPVNALYDFLDMREMVHISKERKIEIFKDCKEKYKAEHSISGSLADYAINRKILQEIEHGTDRINAVIKIKAKQKALIEVFKDIKESGMSMSDYLEINGF